jgi:glycine dehydrogenase subunit 2
MKEIQRNYHEVADLLQTSHNTQPEANGYIRPVADSEIQGAIPEEFTRTKIENFPQLSEIEVVRHFTKLSQLNFGIDSGSYPLGSCTMKYNPKINDTVASMSGFSKLHPYAPTPHTQGALEVMYKLQQALVSITGMKACSLHPAAGAQGELVGVKMIHAYHKRNGQKKRNSVIIPDSAHGTNPASAALSALQVKQLKSNEHGTLSLEEVEKGMDETVAALMITVPNTLGIFEENILEISNLVHERGGLVYCDGANLNALVGRVDFGKMGVDVMHINLHKTFSTPHGGGGPGGGPVVVSDKLVSYLPTPIVREKEGQYFLDDKIPYSVGKFRAFYGNFGMLVRALCYIYAYGNESLTEMSGTSVLNANYVKAKLKGIYHLPYDRPSFHEAVFTDKFQQKENHVTTLDIAKRLMDYGIHPPTIYFPLIVRGAMMIEPTESESKEELDRMVEAFVQIAKEAKETPEKVLKAPHKTGIKRVDETYAARNPVLTWNKIPTEEKR